jgi:hypothetical protein
MVKVRVTVTVGIAGVVVSACASGDGSLGASGETGLAAAHPPSVTRRICLTAMLSLDSM